MSIKPSAAAEIRGLLAAIASGDEVRRETAIARLAIIGPRAVDRMLATYASADRGTRTAILRALESISDPRAARVARQALEEGGDLAVAAAGALRALLDSPADTTAADALDALVATALSTTADRRVRVAAFDALRDMPEEIRARVGAALDAERDAGQGPAPGAGAGTSPDDALWTDALDGRLPDDPSALRDLISARGSSAPLIALQRLVEALRAREQKSEPPSRHAWRALRGAVHQALALRGSPIALYDLRETLGETKEPLPSSFIAALHAVGDGSCLEPIASAYAAADAADPAGRWRAQLDTAFKAIVARQKISRRSAVIKRLEKKWPAAADALLTRPVPTRSRRSPGL